MNPSEQVNVQLGNVRIELERHLGRLITAIRFNGFDNGRGKIVTECSLIKVVDLRNDTVKFNLQGLNLQVTIKVSTAPEDFSILPSRESLFLAQEIWLSHRVRNFASHFYTPSIQCSKNIL